MGLFHDKIQQKSSNAEGLTLNDAK